MAIVRWRPDREPAVVEDEMNRLFDSFFGRSWLPASEQTSMAWGPKWISTKPRMHSSWRLKFRPRQGRPQALGARVHTDHRGREEG